MIESNVIVGISIIILNLFGLFYKKGRYLILTAMASLVMVLLLLSKII